MLNFFKKVNFSHCFWFLFYFFIFCLLLRNSYNYLDPDFGWHLQVGQEIALSHSVPDLNHYNYPYTGSWVDHEWLANYLLYLGFQEGGYLLVSLFFALLIVIILVLLHLWARRTWPDIPTGLVVFFQSLGVAASLPHFGVRIQEISLLFLLLTLLIIDNYNCNRNWRVLWFLPPLFFIWSCSHAGFLMGLFILGAWLGIKVGERLLARFWPRIKIDFSSLLSQKDGLLFTVVVAVSFLVTLLTPYRLELYSFLSGYGNIFYQSHIQEWLPQSSFPFNYWQLFYLSLVVGLFGLYVYEVFKGTKFSKLDLWQAFLVVLFVALSFKSRRHFPLMFVATLVGLLQAWRHIFYDLKVPSRIWGNYWLRAYLVFCICLVGIFQLIQTRFTTNPAQAFCGEYPCGAVKFLQANQVYRSLNIFNNYGWGGYLIWQLPGWPLFIDGRIPQTVLTHQTYLEEYYEFFTTDDNIAKKLNQYDIKLALIPAVYKSIEAKNWEKIFFMIRDEELRPNTALRDYFYKTKDWELIYNDGSALLFKRIY